METDLSNVRLLFSKIIGTEISTIFILSLLDIQTLNDETSFDAYIEYMDSNG